MFRVNASNWRKAAYAAILAMSVNACSTYRPVDESFHKALNQPYTLDAGDRLYCVTASGGVTANRALRRELAAACLAQGFMLRVAEPRLCTDNAAMIGILAERKFLQASDGTSLDADIAPGLALG